MMQLLPQIPKTPFSQQHLLTLLDYSSQDIQDVLCLAMDLKGKQKAGIPHKLLDGKMLAMIFTKSSTRTRVSFETGIFQLGGTGMFLSPSDTQLGRGEPIEDTGRVLGRMVDGIMIRTFKQSDVETLAKVSGIPVINALTDLCHPCQALADMLTYYEHKGSFAGKLAFIGDGNNVCNSLIIACAKVGLNIMVACPPGYEPDTRFVEAAKVAAQANGSAVVVGNDPKAAVADADCIYTDTWTSMGQEKEGAQRVRDLAAYQVNDALAALAKPDFIFQHCLPAHRGEEVTPEIIDGAHSVIFDEAENRLHAQKAVMALLMGR